MYSPRDDKSSEYIKEVLPISEENCTINRTYYVENVEYDFSFYEEELAKGHNLINVITTLDSLGFKINTIYPNKIKTCISYDDLDKLNIVAALTLS